MEVLIFAGHSHALSRHVHVGPAELLSQVAKIVGEVLRNADEVEVGERIASEKAVRKRVLRAELDELFERDAVMLDGFAKGSDRRSRSRRIPEVEVHREQPGSRLPQPGDRRRVWERGRILAEWKMPTDHAGPL